MSNVAENTTVAGSQSIPSNSAQSPPTDAKPADASVQSSSPSDQKPAASVSTSSTSSTTPEIKVETSPKIDDKIGSKFAALAKKERLVVQKAQELKAAEAALKAEDAKLKEWKSLQDKEISTEREKLQSNPEMKEFQEFKALKKMSALDAFKKLGFSYEQLTEQLLNEGKPTPEQLIESKTASFQEELKALRAEREAEKRDAQKAREAKELEAAKKAEDEAAAQAKALEDEEAKITAEHAETISNFRKEIKNFLTSNSDEYELTNLNEANEVVFATIERHFDESQEADAKERGVPKEQGNGKVLSIKEASDAVEHFLETQVQKNLATKKLQAKVSPQVPKEDTPVKQNTDSVKSTKTITNDMTSSSVSSPAQSEKERWKRAVAALNKS